VAPPSDAVEIGLLAQNDSQAVTAVIELGVLDVQMDVRGVKARAKRRPMWRSVRAYSPSERESRQAYREALSH